MSNFEYIIASLPYLTADFKYQDGHAWDDVVAEIQHNLSDSDNQTLQVLLDGFVPENLNEEFYTKALSHPNKFLREYFRFDLNLRNAKVRYLNAALGRDAGKDVMEGILEETDEFLQADKVASALALSSLLDREQALDDITWETVDGLGTFHYFDITAVMEYLAKLHIVDRWLALDQERGRELFRKLVMEVKGTFKGVEYKDK